MQKANTGSWTHKIKAILLFLLAVITLAGCSSDDGEDQEEAATAFGPDEFLEEVQLSSDIFSEALVDYQVLVKEHPIQPFMFEDEMTEAQNMPTEILNNFETEAEVQHMTASDMEDYLFYEYESDEKLGDDSSENKKAYIGLYFIHGALVQAGVFSNQLEFPEEDYMANEKVNEVTAEGTSLESLAAAEPTVIAFSQMNYDSGIHTLPGFISHSASGGNIFQMPVFNPENELVKVENENLRLVDPTSINTTMINVLLGYYTEDVLGIEQEDSEVTTVGGTFIPYEEFEKERAEVRSEAMAATEEEPLIVERVKEIMGEPYNQSMEAIDYRSQKAEGEVEILTVVFNEDEEVESVSMQTQANELEFPFDKSEIESLGYMDVNTTIEEIEEMYVPAPIKELNLETKETMYMWYTDDPEAELSIVQIVIDEDGMIQGIAVEENNGEASSGEEENTEEAEAN